MCRDKYLQFVYLYLIQALLMTLQHPKSSAMCGEFSVQISLRKIRSTFKLKNVICENIVH